MQIINNKQVLFDWDDLTEECKKKLEGQYKYIDLNHPLITANIYYCLDCGIPCLRANSAQKRCILCQDIYRKYRKRILQRERREKEKAK